MRDERTPIPLSCRCVTRTDGWISNPIDLYGCCVVCYRRVVWTLAGRQAAQGKKAA